MNPSDKHNPKHVGPAWLPVHLPSVKILIDPELASSPNFSERPGVNVRLTAAPPVLARTKNDLKHCSFRVSFAERGQFGVMLANSIGNARCLPFGEPPEWPPELRSFEL